MTEKECPSCGEQGEYGDILGKDHGIRNCINDECRVATYSEKGEEQ